MAFHLPPKVIKNAKDLLARRYRKTSEVEGAYVRNILQIPTVRKRDAKKNHEYFNIESLQTLQIINKLNTAVRFTFDKLDGHDWWKLERMDIHAISRGAEIDN